MGWKDRLKAKIFGARARPVPSAPPEVKARREYERDLEKLRRLREEEKRLGVKAQIRRKEKHVRGMRREGSLLGRLLGEDKQKRSPRPKRKKKRKKAKPRRRKQPKREEKEERRDAFGVPY